MVKKTVDAESPTLREAATRRLPADETEKRRLACAAQINRENKHKRKIKTSLPTLKTFVPSPGIPRVGTIRKLRPKIPKSKIPTSFSPLIFFYFFLFLYGATRPVYDTLPSSEVVRQKGSGFVVTQFPTSEV